MKKSIKKLNETAPVMKFIRDIGSKNYAEAQKSLKMAIENKLYNKISAHKNINIFKDE